jgi:hypothetical protein
MGLKSLCLSSSDNFLARSTLLTKMMVWLKAKVSKRCVSFSNFLI